MTNSSSAPDTAPATTQEKDTMTSSALATEAQKTLVRHLAKQFYTDEHIATKLITPELTKREADAAIISLIVTHEQGDRTTGHHPASVLTAACPGAWLELSTPATATVLCNGHMVTVATTPESGRFDAIVQTTYKAYTTTTEFFDLDHAGCVAAIKSVVR